MSYPAISIWIRSPLPPIIRLVLLLAIVAIPIGCSSPTPPPGQAAPQSPGRQQGGKVAVEATIAKPGSLEESPDYTGTTLPVRLISLRAQVEGQVLQLQGDMGDRVQQGQVMARLDDRVLLAEVNEALAELAALQSEVAQEAAQVSRFRSEVEQARVELEQTRLDAARLASLAEDGAIAQQQADLARTAMLTAEQALRSAQEEVRTQQQAVSAAQRRVSAQQSVVNQIRERQAFTVLQSPISGAIVERVTEPGNLVQPGNELLKIGDFSQVKVVVQVSELELAAIRVGQSVQVRFDALPEQSFTGRVSRISPAADPTARLIPVEIILANPDARIGSGLLARVNFGQAGDNSIVIPQSALELGENQAESTLFVLVGTGEAATVATRSVQVGAQANGQVEIRSGLKAGEAFVVRSSKPLADGQPVRLSMLSDAQ